MRYYTDASRAANILDPLHSRGGDLEIESEVFFFFFFLLIIIYVTNGQKQHDIA